MITMGGKSFPQAKSLQEVRDSLDHKYRMGDGVKIETDEDVLQALDVVIAHWEQVKHRLIEVGLLVKEKERLPLKQLVENTPKEHLKSVWE